MCYNFCMSYIKDDQPAEYYQACSDCLNEFFDLYHQFGGGQEGYEQALITIRNHLIAVRDTKAIDEMLGLFGPTE